MLIFPLKDFQLAALLQNFKGSNHIHQVSVPSILSGEAKLSMASCCSYNHLVASVVLYLEVSFVPSTFFTVHHHQVKGIQSSIIQYFGVGFNALESGYLCTLGVRSKQRYRGHCEKAVQKRRRVDPIFL